MSSKSASPSPRYFKILCEFMAFFHQKPQLYPKEHEFTEDELTAITPADLLKWMNTKAFGVSDPGPETRISGSGASSLEFMKKAVSFYMPHKESWNPSEGRGNPTRSREVKELCQRAVAAGAARRRRQGTAGPPDTASRGAAAAGANAAAGAGADARGLLRRTQAQNAEFGRVLTTMGAALQTLGRAVEQMQAALETNNIAIRHELATRDEEGEADNEANGEATVADEGMLGILAKEAATEKDAQVLVEMPRILAMEAEMKKDAQGLAETLQKFATGNVATSGGTRILSGADGFCTFSSGDAHGQQTDVPEGFDLPSCALLTAWRHWLLGFPDFKVHTAAGAVRDAPIRPLRFISTPALPPVLRKKFKDGWRPILLSMQEDVAPLLAGTPPRAADEGLVRRSYAAALRALAAKAPGLLAGTDAERYGAWKVATWSRKIREQQLGRQQVRRREEGDAAAP